MKHVRLLFASSVCLLACGAEPPAEPVTINCAGPTDVTVNCNNGDGNQIGNNGDNNEAGGGSGEPRDGGTEDSAPPTTDASEFGIYTCYSYAEWSGKGAPCLTDEDCPPADSPCVRPICGLGGVCAKAPVKLGALLCGSPYFSCVDDQCCGAWPID